MKQLIIYLIACAAIVCGCDSETHNTQVQHIKDPPAISADIRQGRQLAASCKACHGKSGAVSINGAPFLAGQQEQYLINAMLAYSRSDRVHDAMNASFGALTETDIRKLAAFYSVQRIAWKRSAIKSKTPGMKQQNSTPKLSKTTLAACISCHGKDGNSRHSDVPSLAGLAPEYMTLALESYISGARVDPYMTNFKLTLTSDDIASLVDYFSQFSAKSTSLPVIGDTRAGQTMSKQCTACHGSKGNSIVPPIPGLAGQNAAYLVNAIKAYKQGLRDNKFMRQTVSTLPDEEIKNLAAYYAVQKPEKILSENQMSSDFHPLKDGARITETCNACHGAYGNSEQSGVPSLAGLHPVYLSAAISDYQKLSRKHELMTLLVSNMSELEIDKVSLYYASQDRNKTNNLLKGDVQKARKMVASCNGCHGINGNSNKALVPSLAGQDANYLMLAIESYVNGSRQHEEMKQAVMGLSQNDRQNIAVYYAGQQAVKSIRPRLRAPEDLAKQCDRCHGDRGFSTDVKVPRIAGQVPSYLLQTLHDYKNKTRIHSAMHAMTNVLSLVEINAIANYYANQKN